MAPTVTEEAWAAFEEVLAQRRSGAYSAVFGLDESDPAAPRIVLIGQVALTDSNPHAATQAMLDEQELRWVALTLPYRTEAGGERAKFCFVRWVSDQLTRPSMKESVRLKSGGVMFGAPLASRAHTAGAVKCQANDWDDFALDELLARASKHERDPVDKTSINHLR